MMIDRHRDEVALAVDRQPTIRGERRSALDWVAPVAVTIGLLVLAAMVVWEP
ncbi:MAG: hypothetical protein LCH93_13650 [Proteobacteria bacterium]|nr:hypothetical protein [Pseudomonadota bacterium]